MKTFYQYTRDDQDFEAVKFAASVVKPEKDEGRAHLIYVYVKGGIIYGTDGSRLHAGCAVELQEGFYKVVKNTKSMVDLVYQDNIDMSYPDAESIFIPTVKKTDELNILGGDETEHSAICNLNRAMPENCCINIYHVIDLCKWDRAWAVDIHVEEKCVGPILWKAGNLKAAIMPRRI